MSVDKDPETTEAAATLEAVLAACKALATEPHDRRLLRQLGSATRHLDRLERDHNHYLGCVINGLVDESTCECDEVWRRALALLGARSASDALAGAMFRRGEWAEMERVSMALIAQDRAEWRVYSKPRDDQ